MPQQNSIAVSGLLYSGVDIARTEWQVPEEVPVAIQLNSEPYAVMMATPANLEDFGLGFVISEGLVRDVNSIRAVLPLPTQDGYAVDLAIDRTNLNSNRLVRRNLEGWTGCGLCGVAEIEEAIRLPAALRQTMLLDPIAVAQAYEELPRFQPMNAINRTVHAAAWCNAEGHILLSREDVGRHNALDKLIGALGRSTISVQSGFVVMSSRCSFELVQKCAFAGIAGLATISAPTALALRLAQAAGVQLAAHARGGVMIFDRTGEP